MIRPATPIAATKAQGASVSGRPLYIPSDNEEKVFKAAHAEGLAVMLKGPTGVGKTRLVQSMAYDLQRPLITVACHEDLTAADLLGRYLLKGGETVWEDGPLTRAVRENAICYLDEIVEARADTVVVLHPLLDHRRELVVDRLGETLSAGPGFMLVVSYNPGYQSILKDLKESTRQRMIGIELGFPPSGVEREILIREASAPPDLADDLIKLAHAIRAIENTDLREAASTRALIAAARLVAAGLSPVEAGVAAIARPLSDDAKTGRGLAGLVTTYLG